MNSRYENLLLQLKNSQEEIKHLNKELEDLKAASNDFSKESYEKEYNLICDYIDKEKNKIKDLEDVIKTYDAAKKAIERNVYLRQLLDNEKDFETRREINTELNAVIKEIQNNLSKLDPLLSEELRSSILNNNQNENTKEAQDDMENTDKTITSPSNNDKFIDIKSDVKKDNEKIKRQIDNMASTNFIEKYIDCIKNSNKTINKLANLTDLYNSIPKKWDSKKTEIVRQRQRITNLNVEERKKLMDDICDTIEDEIVAIENDESLSDEEKRSAKQKKYDELESKIFLIEEYPKLSIKNQDEKLDEELESIDKAINEEQKQIKKQMAHTMTMQILLLERYLKKGYDPKHIYEALIVLADIKLDNKELESYMKKTFDETLLKTEELKRIYISYSELENHKKEKKKQEDDPPKKDDDPPIKDDDPPKGDDDPPKKDDDPKPELPKIEYNSPKKTWKTYVGLAAGIGLGAAVYFTTGPVGVSVMAIAGGITKRLLNKRIEKLRLQKLNGEVEVQSIEEPTPGIKGKIEKIKEYFKSEEFCRDAKWFLNGAIYTGLALNVAGSIYNLANANSVVNSPSDIKPETITTNTHPYQSPSTGSADLSNIKIGDSVGGYNVSVGHDTANWAVNGTHTENLISKYVNSDSIFKRFAMINSDGSIGQIINTKGLSITDFCNQAGIDPSQIAVDVASKNGTSQAWTSVSELLKGVGGKHI